VAACHETIFLRVLRRSKTVMDWLLILFLGIVQGVTEFLPVSSSGHLVVTQAIFKQLGYKGLPDVVEVNILLHAGTLFAIIVYYWRQIVRLVREDRRVIGLLAAGTAPLVVVVPIKLYAPGILENALLTGILLVATGTMLIWSGRHREGDCDYRQITCRQAVLIGCFQAVAVLPGLSRSGWTIAGGMLLGLRRDSAATYSFLLAIPAIAGATVLETGKLLSGNSSGTSAGVLALGVAVSFFVGLCSLWALILVIRRGKLQWFAWWCIPLGLAVIIWQLAAYLA